MDFNYTQANQIFNDITIASYVYITQNTIPILMLESVVFGVATVGIIFLGYTELRRQKSNKRAMIRSLLLATMYAALTIHWALSLRYNRNAPRDLAHLWLATDTFSGYPASEISYIEVFLLALNMDFWAELDQYASEAVLFGVLTGLMLFMSLIIFTSDTPPRTFAGLFPFLSVFIMYIMATLHWALGVAQIMTSLTYDFGSNHSLNSGAADIAATVAFLIIVICSDAIVLWRACTIWKDRCILKIISGSLLLITTVSIIVNVAELGRSAALEDSSVSSVRSFLTIPGIVALATSLISNVLATASIAYKAWLHRNTVRRHLYGGQKLLTEKILLIFIDSGLIYTGLWVVYIPASVLPVLYSDTTNFTLFYGLTVYSYIMVQLVAIYPTIIVTLAFLEKNLHAPRISTSSGIQLPPVPLTISTMIRTMPSEVIVINHENSIPDQLHSSADSPDSPLIEHGYEPKNETNTLGA